MRAAPIAVAACLFLSGAPVRGAEPQPATVDQWLESQHVIFRRYLNALRQAQHDFENGYPTPTLIVPLIIDLFAGYVAHIHQVEHTVLYPVAQARLPANQQRTPELLRTEIRREFSSIRRLQQQWSQHDSSLASPALAETLDTLVRLVNRHVVLQEEQIFPVLYSLKPEEHRRLLQQLNAVEQAFVPAGGRQRTLQALDYLEDRIRIDSPRKW